MATRISQLLYCLTALLIGACYLHSTPVVAAEPVFLDQGQHWSSYERKDFYSRDQGSQIMPLKWIVALKQGNGSPFMADSLDRYGYLANPDSEPVGLPVGFTASSGKDPMIGMTCSACHTRQIEVGGTIYRIDGGPAIADFQSFLSDLGAAVGRVLGKPTTFDEFSVAVLGPQPSPVQAKQLHHEVTAWYLRYDTLVSRSLPPEPWGPARLDAVSMIFNRLAGLDIGPPPTHMIPENIKAAVAPVRYPFLWNAPKQDKTQWPGFADNGNSILALSRNLGEVYGVFAEFYPKKSKLGIDFLAANSASFHGLNKLEEIIKKIGPPKWPWAVDQQLAAAGEAIYKRSTAKKDGCVDCHGIKPGIVRFYKQKTWDTQILDVGTDSRQYSILASQVQTGVLEGASIPRLTQPLAAQDSASNVLRLAVIGSILQHYAPLLLEVDEALKAKTEKSPFTSMSDDLNGAFPNAQGQKAQEQKAEKQKAKDQYAGPYRYESRVLEGIWAAAPYLHNGSVPTLAELLKPAAERVAAFQIGPSYDVVNVGLATTQTKFGYTLTTTDCAKRDSGNSRCGHEFGTQLTDPEKKALLEYLKTL